jgi:hypothetical protein
VTGCRTVLAALSISIYAALAAPGPAQAGDAPGTGGGAAAYTLQNGVFSVPLEVRDNQNLTRKAWPACFGVPLPAGLVKEPAALRLLDSGGREVDCQFTVLSRYWGRDNSLRWVLLDFQADVPAGGKTVYRLTNDKPAAAAADAIKVEDGADAVTVSTGALKVVISKKRCSLFESVAVGGEEVVRAAGHDGPRAITEAQDFERTTSSRWAAHGTESTHKTGQRPIKRADYYGDVGAPDEVVIERAGPLHVIVRARGTFRPVEKGEDVLEFGPYNFTYRLHFYRGKDYVRVEHSVENSRFEQPQFQVKLLDHSLWTTLVMDAAPAISYGGTEGAPKSAEAGGGGAFSLYGDKVREVNAQWLDVSGGGKRVGVAGRVRLGDQGAIDLAGSRLAVRPYAVYFGEANPISGIPDKSWGRGSFSLDFGSRRTCDFYYRFAKGEGTSLAELSRGMVWPLFGFAPPQWYSDTAVWNMELAPRNARPSRAKDGAAFDLYGKEAQGLFRKWDFNSGGHHGNLSSLNDDTLMTGNLTELQKNYAITNWNVDFYQWNYRGHEPTNDPEKLKLAHRITLFGPKDYYIWGKRGINPGTYLGGYKYLPDFEHYGFIHLWEQYYLWGDERARESLMRFANFTCTFEADVMFWRAGQKNFLPLEEVDFFDKNHGALHTSHYARIYSWQLYTPLQAYQATGHPVYDLLTKWQLRRLSHLQRLSRGIPEAWKRGLWDSAQQKMWKNIEYPTDEDVTTYQFSAQQWQIAKTMLGFHEAWKIYGDEEILDNLWGEADYFRQVPWQAPGRGIPNGPTIPATLMGKPGDGDQWKPNYHMRTGQALALAWYYTGDQEIRKRMEDHVNGKLDGKTWGHLSTWVLDRKGGRDKLPEKVTDLRCVKPDREGLVFEWTAPKAYGGSGKAVRYFLKYSKKPIVQWAPVNNPDAPADPWADAGKHLAKPECWHPDFLKKDAFWMATHVEGEPVPGEAGRKESCTVTTAKPHNYYGLPLDKMLKIRELPAGKYHFALCSWDEDNNLSEPSNVVEVELK